MFLGFVATSTRPLYMFSIPNDFKIRGTDIIIIIEMIKNCITSLNIEPLRPAFEIYIVTIISGIAAPIS